MENKNYKRAADILPKNNCYVIIYDIRRKMPSFAKFKDGYFEISYIGNSPVCLSEFQYPFIFWFEVPKFDCFFSISE
jgi:hypothetical protein